MLKRGQVTLFIIITIFIVASITVFFIFKSKINIENISPDFEPFYLNLKSCLEDISNEGIYFIATHGGYYNVPSNSSIIYFLEEIPYYYLNEENLVPNINIVEKELGEYISDNLEGCINLEFYENQSFDIDIGEYSVLTKIDKSKVNIKMLNSISISKGDDSTILKNIEIEIEEELENLYFASSEVASSYVEKPGFVCLTCLDDLAEKYNVNIKSTSIGDFIVPEDSVIWYFITNKNDNSEDKLNWVFIVEK